MLPPNITTARVNDSSKSCFFAEILRFFFIFCTQQKHDVTTNIFFQNSLLTAVGPWCRPSLLTAKRRQTLTADNVGQHWRSTMWADIDGRQCGPTLTVHNVGQHWRSTMLADTDGPQCWPVCRGLNNVSGNNTQRLKALIDVLFSNTLMKHVYKQCRHSTYFFSYKTKNVEVLHNLTI